MTKLAYEFIVIKENNDPLIILKEEDFFLKPIYYSQGLSQTKDIYLRKTVVDKLLKIQRKLKKYRFLIWDGYRTRDAQKRIYQRYRDELKDLHPHWDEKKLISATNTFVSAPYNPDRIPPHVTGGAIDLTLADKDGKELPMGTVFDYFGPQAAPYYYEENKMSKEIRENRKLFRDAMFAEDFSIDMDEWWHFNYGNQFWAVQTNKPFALYGEKSI